MTAPHAHAEELLVMGVYDAEENLRLSAPLDANQRRTSLLPSLDEVSGQWGFRRIA